MSLFKVIAAASILTLTSACAGGAIAVLPGMEDMVQAELGNQESYTDKGLDWIAERLGCELPRDPHTGDC